MIRGIFLVSLMCVLGCGQKTTEDWLKQLKDQEVQLRREAIRELGARTDEAERIVPALTEMLHDQSHYVRHDAVIALGKFGSEARGAFPAVKALLKDKEQSVRQGANATLRKIAAEGAPTDRNR